MPKFTISGPDGKSYDIDGENSTGALDALKKHLDTKPTSFEDRFSAAPDAGNQEAIDHGLSERQKLSSVGKALSPVTEYPAVYDRMNKDARGQMSRGVDQISHPGSLTTMEGTGLSDILSGAGNVAMGAAGYVGSPISAAYRTVVGQPIEDVTGIPREIPEFAAQLATPGIGITGASKAAPLVAKTVAKEAAPTIKELKTAASANYESPALTGLDVKPSSISDFATKTKIELNNGKGAVDENLAPKTFAILSKLEKIPDGPASVFSGRNLQSLRELLGSAAGEPGKEGMAASKAIKALDDHIPNIDPQNVIAGDPKAAGEALATANADYSAAKHAETIDNKTIRADRRAAASNSGMNVANTVRQRFADILNPERPDLQRGFKPDELAMMEQVVRGSSGQNALRYAGNFLGGGGGMASHNLAAIGGTAGAVVAGPAGAFIGATVPSALGYTLKAMGNRSTLKAAGDISEAIRSRAPLASAAQKFEVKAGAFDKTKSSATYAGVLLAARNLSNNLRVAGINFSPSELMNGLQMSGVSRADQQDGVPGKPSQ